MWRLDRVGQYRSVSNFDVVRRFVVHPKEEFYMRFKKRAVLLTALAVTAVSAATVSQPASAKAQYPAGSTIQSIYGYTLFTKLTATNATCDNETTKAWSVDWSFAGTAQSPEFETKIENVSQAFGPNPDPTIVPLAAGKEIKQPAEYPQPAAYRDNRFTSRANYIGTATQTLTVGFKNTVFSANPATVGEDNLATVSVKSPCASETDLGMVQAGASVFTPVPPDRLLDTRSTGGKFADQETRKVQITGTRYVPATGVSAVVLNVTATEATKAGFVTVWPGGGVVPAISNINVVQGQTVPNLVTVQVGSDGYISVFSDGGTHVLVDVMGYYSLTDASARAGRYQAVPLKRALDTRDGGAPGAQQSVNVPIAGKWGVPANATAAVLNLTVAGVKKGGFTTVYPGGTARPVTSNLNSAGEDRANQAIVKLGADGSVDVFSENGSDIIVDVAGYFTGASAPLSRSGLFIPIVPLRVLNTRDGLNYDVNTQGKPGANTTTYARVGERGGIDTGYAGSVVTNVTAVDASAAGFVTVYVTGTKLPDTSSLNPAKGETVPNHTTTALGTSGDIAMNTTAGAHFIVDAFGWYTA
jgi:hypothetical protein